MYVKSLTLKGFKSFASATTMRLEPGITCIVGPNGSGKSNVVDALAWVMGEQGAKSLRGGKMEDVIFAGTSGRQPLGRAEVSMTIDNSDGALPIDYTEVTITRTMFRSGGSEYAINGTSCRLLDVQELLSDSGIGREMHVIVGQGQLDSVLRATPEERRGFIEEAAGVLKHRKRKERALRKLETMEGNLTRLADLTTEIRRQLGPLGRQAETARRAASIQAEVRDARLRILADDLVQLTSALEQEIADEQALVARRTAVQEAVEAADRSVAELERERAEAAPALTEVQDRWYSLSSALERMRALRDLAGERVRLLGAEEEELRAEERGGGRPGGARDPEQLRAQAEQVRAEESALLARVGDLTRALEDAEEERVAAEQAHAEEQNRLQRLARAAADRREGLARLAGQVAARRSRIEAGEGEIQRLQAGAAAVLERAARAEQEFAALEGTVLDVEEGEEGLDAEHEAAEEARVTAEAEVVRLVEELRAAQADQATLQARIEALSLSLRRTDGASALLAAEEVTGLRGTLTSHVHVEPGREAAVAAALGWAGEALVTDGVEPARQALGWLREQDQGRAGLLVPESAVDVDRSAWPQLPGYAVWAADTVGAEDPGLVRAVTGLLARVALVGDADEAARLVGEVPGVTVVTADGDVYGPGWARGGSSAAPSLIELQSALDEARAGAEAATALAERLTFELKGARTALEEAEGRADAALDALHDSDARMTAVAEQLAQLGQTMRAARSEHERTTAAVTTAQQGLEATRAELAELEQRLADAESTAAEAGETAEPDTGERERLAEAAARARSAETEARLALRTQEERARALSGRAEGLEAAARNELAARERAARRRARRAEERRVADAVATGAAYLARRVERLVAVAAQEREAARAEQTRRDEQLAGARARAAELAAELRDLTDSVHADEIARAEQRLRIEALQTRAMEELGVDPGTLVEEYGPHLPVPHIAGPDDDPDDLPEPHPFVRDVQDKRLRSAERKLAQLGRVNPLALEEFAALEERHTFLTEQLEDLRRSKADLLEIVKEVDERVERVFAEAFHDTAEQFERVFSRLFPGGEGRITLTDPGNMLTTGIEVEARPPGKKIKRLSLLSGGERSLTAVALLVAIFKARPSPFYIMDEVEAALDDTNLGRLITLFEELRDSSQLIVITHQKRTMEVADALYGVSMRGDGVTTVVSQRVRDVAPAGARGPGAGPLAPDGDGSGEGTAPGPDRAGEDDQVRSPQDVHA
ncbi:chromosome segregation protein SMC [Ornithinimicrobium pekingense]|uniref:Chromosome partition protein Smc n=1 Tax=Ornithinimicrobium pekingense TaxID=384677 RepID=A0ABQ2F5J7_9MICO|nr:chromosome segregation protein SMC [Ornithinimicrobium pekingense]GGK62658.1 chromosome partition protein Smc [Ornithinimicrobium pekingense]